jgi:peptidoglycan/xylan/chitin deacetylase (PgdA/CDA1 family)
MTSRAWTREGWTIAAALVAVVAIVVGVVFATRGGRDRPGAVPAPVVTAPSALPSATSAVPTSPPTTTHTHPATTSRPPFPPALRGQDVTVLPTSSRVVALTFDAGSNSAGLARILHTLGEEHVSATFFLTGRWVAANPSDVAAIRSGGHRIGNHSVSHPHLPQLSDAAVRDEILGAQRAIRAAAADPRPLFRFPYGDRDARTIAIANDLGYVAVRWTVDTLGWQGSAGGMDAGHVVGRVLDALRPGEIVLMHVGSNPDDGTTLDAAASCVAAHRRADRQPVAARRHRLRDPLRGRRDHPPGCARGVLDGTAAAVCPAAARCLPGPGLGRGRVFPLSRSAQEGWATQVIATVT